MDRELGIKKIVSLAAGGRQLLPKGVILEAGGPKFLRTIKRNLDGPFLFCGFNNLGRELCPTTDNSIIISAGSKAYMRGPFRLAYTRLKTQGPTIPMACRQTLFYYSLLK